MKRRLTVMMKACAVAALLAVGLAAELRSANKEFVFLMPLSRNTQSKQLVGMLERVGEVVGERGGFKIKMVSPQYISGERIIDMVEKMFKEGKADFGYVFANEYVRYVDSGGKLMTPIFSMTLLNKPSLENCVYVRKKDGFKKIADLRGKNWGGQSLTPLFHILHENGVKEPPEKFFAKMMFVPEMNRTENLDALLGKKVDAVTADSLGMMLALGSSDHKSEIDALYCTEQYHNWIFVAKKGTPENVVNEGKKLFLNAHKDKAFQEFWWFLTMMKGHFVPFNEAELKRTRELVKLEDKNGWDQKDRKFQVENWKKYFKATGVK